jgi:glycolate oxidase
VLRFCHDTKLKVVPRGAGTSLCGGALPLEDAIVLGISRISKVLAIDVTNRAARVEAGVTTASATASRSPTFSMPATAICIR